MMMKLRLTIVVVTLLVVAAAAAVTAGSGRPSTLPPEKQAMADKIAALKAAADAPPAAKVAPAGLQQNDLEAVAAVGGTPAGIGRMFTDAETMRPPGYPDDIFTNSWSVASGAINIDVWAAARGSDPRRGFLLVVLWNTDRTSIIGGGEYEPSAAKGALRITGAQGTILSIRTSDGTNFTIDAAKPLFK